MTITSYLTNTPVSATYRTQSWPLPGNTGSTTDVSAVRYNGTVTDSFYRDTRKVDPEKHLYDGYYKLTNHVHPTLHYVNATLDYDSSSIITVPNRMHYRKSVSGTVAGWIPVSNSLLGESSQHKALLINNVVKGVNEKHVSLAMFIGEMDDTFKLISGTAQRMVKAWQLVKAGRFAAAARILNIRPPRGMSLKKSASSNYLALSFGWMPIIDDMAGIMKHLHSRGNRLLIQSRSRLTTIDAPGSIPSQTIVATNGSTQDRLAVNWKYNYSRERREQVNATYRLGDPFWDDANRLGFLNPFQLTWEAIPLSFVVDTFANVGEYLGNLSNSLGLEFVSAAYTQDSRQSFDIVGTCSWLDVKPSYLNIKQNVGKPMSVKGQDYRMERIPLQEWELIVSFVLRSPLSINNAITDTALLVQRLGK